MKIFVKLSIIALILGVILLGAGSAMGGDIYISWVNGRPYTWNQMSSDEKQVLPPDTSASTLSDHEIENLEFSLGRGTYTITLGKEFSISGTGLDQIKDRVDGDTWHISYSTPHSIWNDTSAKDRNVLITIPENLYFDKIEIDVGAADITLCTLTAQDIDISIGAGKLIAAPLTADTFSAEIGAGILSTDALTANEIRAEIGAGQANLTLADSWNNYHYISQYALGTITLNGQPLFHGIGESSGGTGSRALELTVGVGSIALTTKQG